MPEPEGVYESIQEHWVGEEDVLTGRHTEWLLDEIITGVVAVSDEPTKVEVDSPGIINSSEVSILGKLTAPGQATFINYRVIGGKPGQKVVITVTITTDDPNRTDIGKHLIKIKG